MGRPKKTVQYQEGDENADVLKQRLRVLEKEIVAEAKQVTKGYKTSAFKLSQLCKEHDQVRTDLSSLVA